MLQRAKYKKPAPEKLLPQFDFTTYLEMLQRAKYKKPAPEKLLPQFDFTTYLEMLQRVIPNCLSSQTFSGWLVVRVEFSNF